MAEFLMPSLGADMETGTLIEWEKDVGDIVNRGDVIAVIETQKGAIEIEAFESGVLESQLVEIGKSVPVGTPLAFIGKLPVASDSVPEHEAHQAHQAHQAHEAHEANEANEANQANQEHVEQLAGSPVSSQPLSNSELPLRPTQAGYRKRITPLARRRAADAGINIQQLQGSGSQNAIVLKDVESAIETGQFKSIENVIAEPSNNEQANVADINTASVPTDNADKNHAHLQMRAAISAAMTRSKREIPHYYLSHSIDLSHAERWLTSFNANRDASLRVLLGVLFLKAVSLAAVKYPEFNGFYKNGAFKASTPVHAGMAIHLRGGGLVAPAIHNTDKLDIAALMTNLRDITTRVRSGRFRAAELSDPTITVSSLGERGVHSLYGVIYPPQVAIIGFGTPVLKPWIGNENGVTVRKVTEVTLAADHRVSDGHRGALFLRDIQKNLEQPEAL